METKELELYNTLVKDFIQNREICVNFANIMQNTTKEKLLTNLANNCSEKDNLKNKFLLSSDLVFATLNELLQNKLIQKMVGGDYNVLKIILQLNTTNSQATFFFDCNSFDIYNTTEEAIQHIGAWLYNLHNEYIDLIDMTSLNSVAFFDECVNNMFYDIDFSLQTLFAKRLYEKCLQMGLKEFINSDWLELLSIKTLS